MSMAVCLFSCKDDNSPLDEGNTPQGVNVTFDYSQAKLSRSAGSTATLNGTSDVAWKIEIEDGEFFSVEPMEGAAGEFTLTVKAEKDNTSTDKQYSKFIFNAAGRKYPITVIHLEDDIRLEVSYEAETVFEFDKDGVLASPDLTAKPFTATSNTEWTVKTVSETDTWIKVGPEVGEIGENLPISLEVEANPYAEVRTGKFEVRVSESMSFSYTVSQEAAALKYSIKDGDNELTAENGFTGLAGGGDFKTITLNANAGWKIEAADNSQWLKFEPSEGVASLENVSITMTVEPNGDKENPRQGEFIITFKDGESTFVTITAEQNKGEMPEEVTKLLDLKEELEGSGNNVLNWSISTDYNSWDGVKFEGGKLVKLDLSNKGLSGTIPQEIIDFESLDYIDLSNNNLTGNIPAGLSTLKATTFKVCGNKLEGKVVADFVNNSNYESWDAMINIYPQQGDISDQSSDEYNPRNWKLTLSDAGVMRIFYSKLGGESWTVQPGWLTSEIIGKNETDGIFEVDENNQIKAIKMPKGTFVLDGELPIELSMLKALYKIEFQNNDKLTGPLKKAYIQNLTYINFGQCRITMEINELLSLLSENVTFINVSNQGDKITGTNGLDYSIISKFKKFGNLQIKGNKLSGVIDTQTQNFFNNYNGNGKLKIAGVDWDDASGWILGGNNFVLE